jgi:mannose/fructose/N-acetylgalactosamine-specific phosphotransferase system component IIB
MAEDSHRTKKYVVLVLCADATKVSTMNEWNGGVKIKLVNDDHLAYKWSNTQIDKWIELNMKDHKTIDIVKDRKHYNKFKKRH